MGLIMLVVIGAVLGWLATIALRIEDTRGILMNAFAGVLGSLIAGLTASNGVLFGAITGTALLWAVLGAVVLIAGFNLVRSRAYR